MNENADDLKAGDPVEVILKGLVINIDERKDFEQVKVAVRNEDMMLLVDFDDLRKITDAEFAQP